MTPFQMVREFHEAVEHPVETIPFFPPPHEVRFRVNRISEEFVEFLDAVLAHNIVAVADALADLEVVVNGTALSFGIDLDLVLQEVHRSNMSKLGLDGQPVLREDGKVLKGPNYSPPNIKRVLAEQLAMAKGVTA